MRLTPESDSTQHSTERMKGEKYNLIQLNFSIQAAPQRLPKRWPVTSASWSALRLIHIFPRATHKPANTRTSAIVTTRNRLNIIAAHEWVSNSVERLLTFSTFTSHHLSDALSLRRRHHNHHRVSQCLRLIHFWLRIRSTNLLSSTLTINWVFCCCRRELCCYVRS